MKSHLQTFVAGLCCFWILNAVAVTHYVDLNSPTPTPPFTNWPTAATNIQDAVDAADGGDIVLVTNGVYATGGRTLEADPPTNRVFITKAITLLSVNGPGATSIAGYQMPGTINGSAAVRCVFLTNGAVLSGFTLTNGATFYYPPGGDWNRGGAVYAPASGAVVSNCVLIGNSSGFGGAAARVRLENCVIAYNSGGGGASQCSLNHCTVVSNSSPSISGGVHFCAVTNSIVYYNSDPSGSNSWGSTFSHCCTDAGGVGNITNAPALVDLLGRNFHLQSNSPCINAGNNAFLTSGTDLEGNPRVVGGTVDMGAYEFQTPGSILSYAWAQRYGLPTDGSSDFVDSDGDSANNWQEWRADTIPTNALSKLIMVTATNAGSGMDVTWQSVSTRSYWLERATNLSEPSPFVSIANSIGGQAGTKTYTDSTATNSGPYFYRVGVQP